MTDREFLAAWASHAYRSGEFARVAGGSSILHIGSERAKAMRVKWPMLGEQRRIADLIGAIDTHTNAMGSELDALRQLVGALRETLVAEVAWEPIGNMVEPSGIQIGPFGSQLHASEYVPAGVPVVMPQDLLAGEIRMSKIKCIPEETAARLARHRLRPGDLILPRRGDLAKRALVAPEQAGWLCGTGCIRIRLADPMSAPALLEGLSNARTDDWLMTNAVGTTMLNLNTGIVSKLPAPKFSESARVLAETCLATEQTLKAAQEERAALLTVRERVLSALLVGDAHVPESYDDLMTEAV